MDSACYTLCAMPSLIHDFAALSGRSTVELRALLSSDQPAGRVWAAWSLALLLGSAVQSELRGILEQEPSPGVRRHLLVVLAGLGEREILATLAELDPDSRVRATAGQYVARLAQPDDDGTYAQLCRILTHDKAPEVRATIIAELREDAPAEIFLMCQDLLADRDVEIRSAVIERFMVPHDASEHRKSATAALRPILCAHGEHEPEPALRQRLLGLWLEIEGPLAMLGGLARAGVSLLKEALALVMPHTEEPQWEQARSLLAHRAEWSVAARVLEHLPWELAKPAHKWLLHLIVRFCYNPRPEAGRYTGCSCQG